MMIAVVARGTGTPAQIPKVAVAGKTGTATNPLGRSHAWFVCFAPAQTSARRRRDRRRERRLRRDLRCADRARRDARRRCKASGIGELIEERIFNNRYRLDGKLGEGGMATVYCGTDILLRRRVAIKVLREQYAADDEFVRRFYQEAESAAKLSHPNIVNTFDVGRQDDTYFIVMELVDGPSLGEIIAADGRLPEPVAIDYAAQIASGLAYAHRQGLLHRDIKPANILVTKDDVVKLSDFGIARAVSQQTMALDQAGSGDGKRLLHLARASAGTRGSRDLRSLQPGHRPLPDAHGQAAVYGRIAGDRCAQTHRRPRAGNRRARHRASARRSRRSSTGCLQKNPSAAFNRQANWPLRCARRASVPASPSFRIADDAPGRRTPIARTRFRRAARRCPTVAEHEEFEARGIGAPSVDRGGTTARAPRRNRPRLSSLRTAPLPALASGIAVDGLYRDDASAGAEGRGQRRAAHALYEERERDGAARSRDPSVTGRGHEGRTEPGRRAGHQQRKTAAGPRRRARI